MNDGDLEFPGPGGCQPGAFNIRVLVDAPSAARVDDCGGMDDGLTVVEALPGLGLFNASTTWRPTRPVPPVTKIIG
jgi:hypothetical protein